ncbi:TPA: hypothetical protein HMV67_24055, partial [Escherichia coli]|nr:hypothetical protein [Escherichia coli]
AGTDVPAFRKCEVFQGQTPDIPVQSSPVLNRNVMLTSRSLVVLISLVLIWQNAVGWYLVKEVWRSILL